MTINITPEISAAFDAYLNEPVDACVDGPLIRRRATYPYTISEFSGLVEFAAGYAAALASRAAEDQERK